MTSMFWIAAIPLLGFCTGLRSMTPIAVVCWFAFLGRLAVAHTWAFWAASLISVSIFTLFAFGEYIGDKLPNTPARTALFPLLGRITFGGLVGAIVATGLGAPLVAAIALGAVGAVLGTFLGFHLRHLVVQRSGWPDWRIAVIEDALTIFLAIAALKVVTA